MSTFYYAVHRGRTPGIYSTWKECQEQINGFPYTEYKKFKTIEEAEQFVINGRGENTTNIVKQTQKNIPCKTTITNATIKKTIKNKKNNNVIDREMAILFDDVPSPTSSTEKSVNTKRKKIKNNTPSDTETEEMAILFNDVPSSTTSPKTKGGSVTNKKLKAINALDIKDPETNESTGNDLFIFTDGSCDKNGRKNAKAGVGVYFPHKQFTNVSEKLIVKDNATNQKAELMAIRIALQIISPYWTHYDNIYLITDSKYSIDCITNWIHGWMKNGWINKKKKKVKNRELIEDSYNMLTKMNNITFAHINSHTGRKGFFYEGNDKADKLADKGKKKK